MNIFLRLIFSLFVFLLTLEGCAWVLFERKVISINQFFWGRYPEPLTANPKFRLKTDWSHHIYKGPAPQSLDKVEIFCSADYLELHSSGYSLYKPNFSGQDICRVVGTGETLFTSRYTFDSLGRRLTSLMSEQSSSYHIAFAGCSYTFGHGLPDQDSMPAHFKTLNPKAQVVNLAKLGGSISDLIFHLTVNDTTTDLSSNGVLILSFIGNMHMHRFLVSIRVFGVWYKYGPAIEYDEITKKFVYKGITKNVYPIYSRISDFLMASHFFKLLGWDWPNPKKREYYYEYAKAIDFARQLYRQKNKNRELIVMLNPDSRGSRGIIDALEERKIPYLDYTNMPIKKISNKKLFLDRDGHPSEEYNKILASQISYDLRLPENKKFLEVLQR